MSLLLDSYPDSIHGALLMHPLLSSFLCCSIYTVLWLPPLSPDCKCWEWRHLFVLIDPVCDLTTQGWFWSAAGFLKEGLRRRGLLMTFSFRKLVTGIVGQGSLISCSSFLPDPSERLEECGPLCGQLPALWPQWQGHAAEPGVLSVPQGQVGTLGRAFPAQTSKCQCARCYIFFPPHPSHFQEIAWCPKRKGYFRNEGRLFFSVDFLSFNFLLLYSDFWSSESYKCQTLQKYFT